MTEAAVENPVVVRAEEAGWFVRKMRWIGRVGAPDRFFAKDGRIVLIEFKAKDKAARRSQELEHGRLRAAGVETHVCDTVIDALTILGIRMTLHPTAYTDLIRRSDKDAAELVFGSQVTPKFIHDLEAYELIYGPPPVILSYNDFRGYQKWMSELIIRKDVFLAAEMGLGKTAASLYAIRELFDLGFVKRVLIVAPLNVAEDTWAAEIAKWDFARDFTFRIVTGTEEERMAALKEDVLITIINRENLAWLQRKLPGRNWDFDMLVYDEASRLKSGRKRSKPKPRSDGTMPPKKLTELGILRRYRFKFKRVVELSGTPSPNGLIDLWGPIYLIDQGKRLGDSMTKFKNRWFKEDRWTHTIEPFEHSEREIMSRIKDVFYSLREEDYLKLPPLQIFDHEVHMTRKQMDGYRELEREMALEIAEMGGKEFHTVEAVNQGVLTGKLLQYANGSLYLEDKTAIRIHEAKLDKLESIVTEAMGTPILCAYSFQFDKVAIKKRFPFARFYGETKNDMRDWNAGKIKLLVTHPASAGHGLNFQHGSNIAVWYGMTWSLELYRQFMKRLHRSGQKADKVFLHRILTAGTMDWNVVRALQVRGAKQDDITEAVRVRLEEVAAAA